MITGQADRPRAFAAATVLRAEKFPEILLEKTPVRDDNEANISRNVLWKRKQIYPALFVISNQSLNRK